MNLVANVHQVLAEHSSRSILAGAVGNMLEWYDFAAYGYFSAIIGRHFFPSDTPNVSLLSAFAVFAAAFFMRPIGGILFGGIGDRLGTKKALLVSAALMSVSTFAIGCLPTYDSIGILAPILLVLLRLGQGMSVGGEYTTSSAFLVTNSDPGDRGLLGSLAPVGAASGLILGSFAGVTVSEMLAPAEIGAWGWRIPFLLGIALGMFVLVLRSTMQQEAAPANRSLPSKELPIREALRTQSGTMLRVFVAILALAASFYLTSVYLVTYMQTEGGISQHTAFVINTASMLLMLLMLLMLFILPLFGMLSDRIGRKLMMGILLACMAILAVPLFTLVSSHQLLQMMLGQMGFAVLVGGLSAAVPSLMVEAFGGRSRNTAMALSYNAAFALAGGMAPMVATALMAKTNNPMSLAYYLIALSALSLIGVFMLKDHTGEPLE